jgi:anti-sigma B factor antagonist
MTIVKDASEDFSVTVTDVDRGRVLIVVLGELDLATAQDLWILAEPRLAPDTLVVVDVSQVPFIDSSGLRVLLQAAHRSQETGATFRVAAPTSAVSRVVEMAGVGPQLDVRGDVGAALTL